MQDRILTADEIAIARLDLADSGLIDQVHALTELARETDAPENPAVARSRFATMLAFPPPGAEVRGYVATGPGGVLGYLHVYLPMTSNRHYAEAELTVHPDKRRRGVGTALIGFLLEMARGEARTELIVIARASWGEGPERSEVGAKFLERHGFSAALTEVDCKLEIAGLDAEVEERLFQEALAAAGDEYRLVSWTGRTPQEYLEPLARIDSMIFDEIPLGDVQLEHREMDLDFLRERDDRAESIGSVPVRTAAFHQATGHIGAHTLIYAFHGQTNADQAITIADPAHRGHRLGLLVKLANLRQLRTVCPEVTAIWAGNADTNAHMVAINRLLGFEPVDARVSYKHKLEG